VPTAAAYRFFAQEIAAQATLSVRDRDWIRGNGCRENDRRITERAGHVLAEVSNGLGIIVAPADATYCFGARAHVAASDGRVVVVLSSPGGARATRL